MYDYTHSWIATEEAEIVCKYCGHNQNTRSEVCYE